MVHSVKAALERSMVTAAVCSSRSYVFTCFRSFPNRIYKDLSHPRYPDIFNQGVNGWRCNPVLFSCAF